MNAAEIRILVLVGPTGTGKSDVAVETALRVNGEIVSADSMLIYRHLDIGTAKPPPAQLRRVPHHAIDIIEPTEPFSVAAYQQVARQAFAGIVSRGRLPILVGGSGLYVRAAVDPLEFPRGVIDSPTRRRLEELAAADTEALWRRLDEVDPAAAAKIPASNVRRVVRALEVIHETGRPFSELQEKWGGRRSIYPTVFIGLTLPREELYRRLDERVDRMLEAGLLDEVRRLESAGLLTSPTARQALGYKELIGYLEGEYGFADAVALLKTRTRQFAKRQYTWFRADPRITWLDASGLAANEIAGRIVELVEAKRFIVR